MPPPAVDSAKASLIWFMNGDLIPEADESVEGNEKRLYEANG